MNEPGRVSFAGEGAAASSPRVRILVVDDSAVSRAYILATLDKLERVEVRSVESGSQALRALGEGGYSLVLCDYEMPDMSGLQLLRFVRAKHTALELPVLLLTGSDDPDIKVRAFRAGANDYIAKHAAAEELLARVGTQIELLEAQRSLVRAKLRRAEGQKFEAIGQLTEALAHELNTPAQYIGDNLAFLLESFESLRAVIEALRQNRAQLSSELGELVDALDCDYLLREIPRCIGDSQEGITNMAGVVALMREFARGGSEQAGLHDLNEIVRGAVGVTRGQWHQVAELTLELGADLPHVQCLGTAIKQVVLYVVTNAVRAMAPDDGIQRTRGQLRIRTSHDAAWVSIEIADSGRAIPREQLARLLDPVLGAGSLAAADQVLVQVHAVIVREHAGQLDIRSAAGEGTRIVMRLPRQPQPVDSNAR